MNRNISIQCKFELKSFHSNFILLFSKSLKKIKQQNPWKTKILISNLVSLPKTVKVFTVLRSPHVDKKSREQFEIRTSKSFFHVSEHLDSSSETSLIWSLQFSKLLKSKMLAGIGVSETRDISFISK